MAAGQGDQGQSQGGGEGSDEAVVEKSLSMGKAVSKGRRQKAEGRKGSFEFSGLSGQFKTQPLKLKTQLPTLEELI
jgi:hypothetical protein